MYEVKTYGGVMRYDNEEWCKIWNRIDLPFQNWHEEFNKFWPEHSKISKICTLMGWFWPKYIMFELKKYRGVMFDGTEDWCKIWRKADYCFQKWHEEFGKFSPEHSEVSKLQFTEELCVMTMKNDAQLEKELTCQFKIDMKNLTDFDTSTQKSQKFAL